MEEAFKGLEMEIVSQLRSKVESQRKRQLWMILGSVTATLFFVTSSTLPRLLKYVIPSVLLHSIVTLILYLLISLCGIALSIAAFVLAWREKISLDALATIILVLTPSVQYLSQVTILQQIAKIFCMLRFKSFRVPSEKHRYLRVKTACARYDKEIHTDSRYMPAGLCTDCRLLVYVRHQPAGKSERDFCKSLDKVPGDRVDDLPDFVSVFLSITKNVIIVSDEKTGMAHWWWKAVSTSMGLVIRPHRGRLLNSRRAINALILISDIIAIGDLVLACHRMFLKEVLEDDKGSLKQAREGTPATVCSLILKEVGLEEWGNPWQHKGYPAKKKEEYGLLFFILAHTSKLFATKMDMKRKNWSNILSMLQPERAEFPVRMDLGATWLLKDDRLSAQTILDELEEHVSHDTDRAEYRDEGKDARERRTPDGGYKEYKRNFLIEMQERTATWLSDWGCDQRDSFPTSPISNGLEKTDGTKTVTKSFHDVVLDVQESGTGQEPLYSKNRRQDDKED